MLEAEIFTVEIPERVDGFYAFATLDGRNTYADACEEVGLSIVRDSQMVMDDRTAALLAEEERKSA